MMCYADNTDSVVFCLNKYLFVRWMSFLLQKLTVAHTNTHKSSYMQVNTQTSQELIVLSIDYWIALMLLMMEVLTNETQVCLYKYIKKKQIQIYHKNWNFLLGWIFFSSRLVFFPLSCQLKIVNSDCFSVFDSFLHQVNRIYIRIQYWKLVDFSMF